MNPRKTNRAKLSKALEQAAIYLLVVSISIIQLPFYAWELIKDRRQ